MAEKHFLVDGHKFGCDFLVYEEHPETTHAKYLLFIEDEGKLNLEHVSRLSNMCKKVGLVAKVAEDGASVEYEEVKYETGRSEGRGERKGDKEESKRKKRRASR